MCGTRNGAISHILSECSKLAHNEFKLRHDSVGRYVHWQFYEKLGFSRARLWYEHEPENVNENENFKILWDFTIQYDHIIEARRPDIVVVDKETMIIDMAIPGDKRLCDKEREKIKKYSLLKAKLPVWEMEKVVVIPAVVGALGTITTNFKKYIENLGIDIIIEHTQKSALLETARIIRKVLSC